MRDLLRSLTQSTRVLARDKTFFVTAVLILAVGLGATTAVFNVAYQVILRSLPYPDADRLVRVWQAPGPRDAPDLPHLNPRINASYRHYLTWRAENHTLSALEALTPVDVTLSGRGSPRVLHVMRASSGLLPMLGVHPQVGTLWAADRDSPGRDDVVLISDELWSERFGRSADAVHQSILLDGKPHRVLGVLPRGFGFAPADAWKPFAASPLDGEDGWQSSNLWIAGRLRPGISLATARADLARISDNITAAHSELRTYTSATLELWQGQLAAPLNEPLAILAALGGLLLVMAWTSVGNLLLGRASTRHMELTVRAALGATARQLFQQFLREGAVLAVVAGGAALLLGVWATALLVPFLPVNVLSGVGGVSLLNPAAAAFTFVLTFLTALVLALAPGMPFLTQDVPNPWRASDLGMRRGLRLRSVLVGAQIAFTLVAVLGAGLMLRTLNRLLEVPLGFDAAHVTLAELYFPFAQASDAQVESATLSHFIERTQAIPGVESVGVVSALPLGGREAALSVELDGVRGEAAHDLVGFRYASEGYFQSVRIPLFYGRMFTSADTGKSTPVILVNATFAHRYFPHESPIGHHLRFADTGDPAEPSREIIGVIGDVRHRHISSAPNAEVFIPSTQEALPRMYLVLRSHRSSAELQPILRAALAEVDGAHPILSVRAMDELVRSDNQSRTLLGWLFSVLAVLGLAMSTVALFGLVSFSVQRRTRELAIRMALGASPPSLVRLIVRQAAALSGGGIGLGLFAAYFLAHALRSFLFGVEELDPLTFTVLPLFLLAVTLCASALAATRVLELEPQRALQSD